MKNPKSLKNQKPINLKLGIKSSFPNAKPSIALLYLLWVSNEKLANYSYGVEKVEDNERKLVIKERYFTALYEYLKKYMKVDRVELKKVVNDTQLFKAQIEAQIVALELIWKLAKVSFEDKTLDLSQVF